MILVEKTNDTAVGCTLRYVQGIITRVRLMNRPPSESYSMAQWTGQYTGKTHLSKIRDRELLLRQAVEKLRQCQTPSDRDAQASAVVRFADDLLRARVRAKRAQIAALSPRELDQREQWERKLRELIDDGVQSILDEFNADGI